MIQKEISDELRRIGQIVIIEPFFDGRNADLLVQNSQTLETTIIEIELHKNYSHAIKSISSDLCYADRVIVLCGNQTILRSLCDYSTKFHERNSQRIRFLLVNRHINLIRTLFQNKDNNKTHNKTQNKIRSKEQSRIKSLSELERRRHG